MKTKPLQMKTLLRSVLIVLLFYTMRMTSWGQLRTEASIDFSEQGYENGQDMDGVVIDIDENVTVVFNKASGNNGPKYYNSGTAIRAYGGNNFTVSSTGTISSITLTFGSGDGSNEIITEVGSFESPTWTGSESEVNFSIGGTSGHRRIKAVTITYGDEGQQQNVATPTFSPTAGSYFESQLVTITCATVDAIIRYTIDGSNPTENSLLYNFPIEVSETTTIKAKAFKDGYNSSSVVTATYQILCNAPSIASISTPQAICAGDSFNLITPTIQNNGSVLINQGWQIAATQNGQYNQFNNNEVPYSYNNYWIRYFAENACGMTYSNAVQITVNDIPVVGNIIDPTPICAGESFNLTTPQVWWRNNYYGTGTWEVGPTEYGEFTPLQNNNIPYSYNGYYLRYKAVNNCGTAYSSNVVQVSVYNTEPIYDSITACDTYYWLGIACSHTGNYQAQVQNENGCMVTAHLHFIMSDAYTETQTVSECDSSYTWPKTGMTYNCSGIHEYTILSGNPLVCDSVFILNLTLYQTPEIIGVLQTPPTIIAGQNLDVEQPSTIGGLGFWEISQTIDGNYQPFSTQNVPETFNGWYLRYKVSNDCGFDVSNAVQIHILSENFTGFHFLGTVSQFWSDALNWVGFPGSSYDVFIDSDCQLNVDAEIQSLNIAEGVSLSLLPDHTLIVLNDIVNTSVSSMTIEDGARLIHNSSDVQATVKKQITGYGNSEDGWYTISTPIINGTQTSDITLGTYDLYYYNEPTAYWMNEKLVENNFVKLNPAHGYLYANQEDITLEFAGQLNAANAEISIPVYYSNGPFAGFNLVGNPFTNNISINSVAINGVAQTAYYKSIGGSNLVAFVYEDEEPIRPCEGFMVKATEAGMLSFNAPSERSEKTGNGYVRLILNKDLTIADRAYLCISGDKTLEKICASSSQNQLYFISGGERFAIAKKGESPSIPLCLEQANGIYTIEAKLLNAECDYLHLIDNYKGIDVNLLDTPSYTFEAKKTDYVSRFKLVFSPSKDADDDNEKPFAYYADGEIHLMVETDNDSSLQMIDMTGRILVSSDTARNVTTAGMMPGVYVLRLINEDNVKTQKIVIR